MDSDRKPKILLGLWGRCGAPVRPNTFAQSPSRALGVSAPLNQSARAETERETNTRETLPAQRHPPNKPQISTNQRVHSPTTANGESTKIPRLNLTIKCRKPSKQTKISPQNTPYPKRLALATDSKCIKSRLEI